MPRKYDDDYEDEPEDEPERPRRRRRSREPLSWIDQQFLNTNMVLLVLFSLCCGGIALIFSIIGVATCKDPQARQKATVTLIISGIMVALAVAVQLASLVLGGRR